MKCTNITWTTIKIRISNTIAFMLLLTHLPVASAPSSAVLSIVDLKANQIIFKYI